MSVLENLSPEKLKKLHTFKSDLLFKRLRHYNSTHNLCKIYKLMHVINEEDRRYENLVKQREEQV